MDGRQAVPLAYSRPTWIERNLVVVFVRCRSLVRINGRERCVGW